MIAGETLAASRTITTLILIAILVVGGPVLGFGGGAVHESEGATSALSVASDPVGATVYIDGVKHGVTPLELDTLPAGDHRVTLLKDDYLENSRIVTLKPGEKESVGVSLTEAEGARYAMQIGTTSGGGGGSKLPLILGIAGAGAAGAYFLLRDTNDPPTAGSITTSPTVTGIASVTNFSFASDATDPDEDSLTFNWDFGDGASGTGQNTSHVYQVAGSFTVTLTVSDGEESATTTTSVRVRDVSGNWRGSQTSNGGSFPFTLSLTQNGTNMSGTYDTSFAATGTVSGSLSAPRRITLTVELPGFQPFTMTGNINDDGSRMNGTSQGSGLTGEPWNASR